MEELQDIHERDIEKRSNGSQVFTEPYSEVAIDRLKNLVVTFYGQGERKYYSILVDGEIVVPKNADGRKFSRYLQFVTEHTKTVEVRMFQGSSPNCNKYLFILNKGKSLSGTNPTVNVQEEIEKALEQQRIQNELEYLREQVEVLTEENEELIQEKENKDTGIKEFTNLIKEGKQLAGMFGFAPKNGLAGTSETVQPDAEVDVEIESEESNSATQPNSDQSKQILNDLLNTYGKKGTKEIIGWGTVVAQDQELQKVVIAKIQKQKNKENGEA